MSHFYSNVCVEITSDDQFAALRAPWADLLSRSTFPSAFCTWDWAWEWWKHFGRDASPRYTLLVCQVHDETGLLVGLAPYYVPNGGAGPLRLRSLRPLATRIHCVVDDLTEEPLILLDRTAREEALRGILRALLKYREHSQWDLIHLRLLREPAGPDVSSIWTSLRHTRPGTWPFVLTRCQQRAGQTRTLPGDWPTFRRSLSKSMRDNVVYYPRLLTRDSHDWQVRIARTPEEVAAAAVSLIALHGSRAQSDRGPAHTNHLPGQAQQEFLIAVLTRLAASGRAAIALLEVQGVPVAAQSVLECENILTFYYSGFDPLWHRYSPVTVLHVTLIQDAIERGLAGLDYLPESEPWKTRWGTEETYWLDDLSCLSLLPHSLLRSAWRTVTRRRSWRRGLECECGFCTLQEQEDARSADPDPRPFRA